MYLEPWTWTFLKERFPALAWDLLNTNCRAEWYERRCGFDDYEDGLIKRLTTPWLNLAATLSVWWRYRPITLGGLILKWFCLMVISLAGPIIASATNLWTLVGSAGKLVILGGVVVVCLSLIPFTDIRLGGRAY